MLHPARLTEEDILDASPDVPTTGIPRISASSRVFQSVQHMGLAASLLLNGFNAEAQSPLKPVTGHSKAVALGEPKSPASTFKPTLGKPTPPAPAKKPTPAPLTKPAVQQTKPGVPPVKGAAPVVDGKATLGTAKVLSKPIHRSQPASLSTMKKMGCEYQRTIQRELSELKEESEEDVATINKAFLRLAHTSDAKEADALISTLTFLMSHSADFKTPSVLDTKQVRPVAERIRKAQQAAR